MAGPEPQPRLAAIRKRGHVTDDSKCQMWQVSGGDEEAWTSSYERTLVLHPSPLDSSQLLVRGHGVCTPHAELACAPPQDGGAQLCVVGEEATCVLNGEVLSRDDVRPLRHGDRCGALRVGERERTPSATPTKCSVLGIVGWAMPVHAHSPPRQRRWPLRDCCS